MYNLDDKRNPEAIDTIVAKTDKSIKVARDPAKIFLGRYGGSNSNKNELESTKMETQKIGYEVLYPSPDIEDPRYPLEFVKLRGRIIDDYIRIHTRTIENWAHSMTYDRGDGNTLKNLCCLETDKHLIQIRVPDRANPLGCALIIDKQTGQHIFLDGNLTKNFKIKSNSGDVVEAAKKIADNLLDPDFFPEISGDNDSPDVAIIEKTLNEDLFYGIRIHPDMLNTLRNPREKDNETIINTAIGEFSKNSTFLQRNRWGN